ncbi:MAG: tetratricopeptide repeat protein [Anaerolineae bacterium]|nr:tetratricopeptide repeat protein [Candidatus Roseilinea sp.]MDW8449686.1 tetratricopeptide repeat protein [Anaerolineae bacterium]
MTGKLRRDPSQSSAHDLGSDAFAQEVMRVLRMIAGTGVFGRGRRQPIQPNERQRVIDRCIGERSFLAAPYVLGRHIQGDTPEARGRALRAELLRATDALDDFTRTLIHRSFFERVPGDRDDDIALDVGLARRSLYRQWPIAAEKLARAFADLVLPPLRAERPVRRPMVGREDLVSRVLADLSEGYSVSLAGAAGIGKTTVGAAVALAWQQRHAQAYAGERVFWYTLRAGWNDWLASFIFAMAYFLRLNGAPNTWRQAAADAGHGPLRRAPLIGVLRHDLGELAGERLLIVLDEADLLHLDRREHREIANLLADLYHTAHLLVIGQRPLIKTDRLYTLPGMSREQVGQMLEAALPGAFTPDEQQRAWQITDGNPILLCLLISLCQTGTSASDALSRYAESPSIEQMFGYLWERLPDEERILLKQLAVFRAPSPQHAWIGQADVLDSLIARGLARQDDAGGVELTPHFRPFVLARMTGEERIAHHAKAALVREAHGEYVAAIEHFIEARRPDQALRLWAAHSSAEIARGQAASVKTLLDRINIGDLDEVENRNALRAFRGQLSLILGDGASAAREMEQAEPGSSAAMRAFIERLLGDAYELLDQPERAIHHYRQAIEAYQVEPERAVSYQHAQLSYMYDKHLRDADKAESEAKLALINAYSAYAQAALIRGDFDAALAHYNTARPIADSVPGNHRSLSTFYARLAELLWQRGRPDEAIPLIEKSMAIERARGEQYRLLFDYSMLSAALIVAGRHEEALAQAEAGLALAKRISSQRVTASLLANAAEACAYLGQLDKAESYAARVFELEVSQSVPYAFAVLGMIARQRRQHAKAQEYFEMAIRAARSEELRDPMGEAPAWRWLAIVHLDQGQRSAAMDAFAQALALYESMKLEHEVEATRRLMAEAGLV